MSIDVNALAALAHLGMKEKQQREFPAQMEGLIEYVSAVKDLQDEPLGETGPMPLTLCRDEEAVAAMGQIGYVRDAL